MSHNALGDQFAEHVASFRDRYNERGWHDPDHAEGQCDKATHLFARHLDLAGVQHHRQLEVDAPDPDDDDGGLLNHFVNVVPHPKTGVPHVVDWTARQFDEKAAYPVIQPRHEYLHNMGMTPAPHLWEGHDDTASVTAHSAKYEHRHDVGNRDSWERR